MRRLSDFRKGVASAFPILASDSRRDGKLTLADVAARIGEDNETLRNLLIDTDHRINALEDLKGTFEKLVEPLSKTLRTLEQEKSDNATLRDALAEIRTSHETLHSEFQARGKKSTELEHDNERLRRELTFAQQAARELESTKADLTGALVTARAAIADLENQLGHETAGSRALGEEHGILLDHANAADRRIVELEAEAAHARENLSLLGSEKSSLQTALDQTLGETSRLSRRLTESDNALTAARARLEQMENSLAAAEAERKKLSAALDEANERRQSECYALNLKLEAMRSRAATAEKLLAEVRQNLSGRTEEIRASERKVVDATVALNAHEKKIERLSALREAQDRHKQELEQTHATLTERSTSLAETVKAREASLAHAEDKIKLLTNRLEQLELDVAATRAKTEKRIEDLNAAVQRERMERAVTEGALETTRRDYARLQRELLAERASRQRNPDTDESSDKSKEPAKSKNGKGSSRGGKAEGAEIKPTTSR